MRQNVDAFVEIIGNCIQDEDGVLSKAREYLRTVSLSNEIALQQFFCKT